MKCVSGCTCGRHQRRRCEDGCTCSRHPAGKPYARTDDYFNNHRTVRQLRGRAPEHQCVTCCQTAAHWALVHGADGTDPHRHYMPMCISCHHAYDGTHERAGFHGRKHSDETRQKMSEVRKGKSWLHEASPERRAEFAERIRQGKRRWEQGA